MAIKNKAITFSYDDGDTQDIRLVEIFNKHNIKGTFNINSGLFGKEATILREWREISHNRLKMDDIKYIYDGHEIAAHTVNHVSLPGCEDDVVIREVENDRIRLSEIIGYEVCGMAYSSGGKNNDDRTAKLIRENTGIKYARALETNGKFSIQENLYRFNGTCYHHIEWDKMFSLAEEFLKMDAKEPSIFYIWGHSFEFDIYPERWEMFDEFCKMISGKSDIFYGTNKEVLLSNDWK
ncbi:MAG: polysaccharide deacetylase family protein [Clostridia bacterium]|nr:polysaccharide deacetylase family protein [Clostridia bacterium]